MNFWGGYPGLKHVHTELTQQAERPRALEEEERLQNGLAENGQ